jgi:hypothetical protein
VSADIYQLSEYRSTDCADCEIDLETAVDAAIRDLRDILLDWGSEGARQRAQECQQMLSLAFSGTAVCGSNH